MSNDLEVIEVTPEPNTEDIPWSSGAAPKQIGASNWDRAVERLKQQIAKKKKAWDFLHKHKERFLVLSVEVDPYSDQIDFDHLTHAQVIEVVKAFPGKWSKSVSSSSPDKIDYETEFDGVVVRCYAGEPPPACKIIEVEEMVPAQPARMAIVRKMVCREVKQ